MSDFNPAFSATINIIEGGYSKDPDDPGGETYRGIARAYHPSWDGWLLIDSLKQASDFISRLEQNKPRLEASVRRFYKALYWDIFRADEHRCQIISDELFDQAVNLPPAQPVLHLQKSLNALNRNGEQWKDILEDGEYGPATHAALDNLCTRHPGDVHALHKAMNVLQGAYYLQKMRESPKKEKYARGWFRRVEFTKSS